MQRLHGGLRYKRHTIGRHFVVKGAMSGDVARRRGQKGATWRRGQICLWRGTLWTRSRCLSCGCATRGAGVTSYKCR
jgi:hypothetical protein